MNKKELQEQKLQKLAQMKKLMEARNAMLREEKANRPGAGLAKLLEGELERAELTLNAQDVVNKLQDTAEDLAKMSVEQLMPLVDEMKGEFGPEAAAAFEQSVGGALDSALQAVRDAREQVNNAVLQMQGKLSDEDITLQSNDMSNDIGGGVGLDGPNDIADQEGGDLDIELDGDEFGGEIAASGEEEEPLGRVRKESVQYSKKKSKIIEGKHEEALVEAYTELAQSGDFNSLKLEIVADKFGVCEEELLDVYNEAAALLAEAKKYRASHTSAIREALSIQEKKKLNEFLPMLAGMAAGAGARALGGAALKKLAGMAAKKAGGTAMNKVGDMFGMGDDDEDTTATNKPVGATSPADARAEKNAERMATTDPKVRELVKKINAGGVQPKDLAGVLSMSKINNSTPLTEHRIIEEVAGLEQDDAIRLIKERIRAVQSGKDLAVRETFPADVKLSTPRMVVKQLSAKYGDPSGWAVAQSGEGSHYVLSAPIPEAEKAKSIQNDITSLEEEIGSIRAKHSDVQEEYQLPQEIKMSEMRKRLGEYQTGYRHQVAKWLTLDEASALISLAQAYAPKKQGK